MAYNVSIADAPHNLQTPLAACNGIGPTKAKHFADLGLNVLGDLLEYFPRTYQYESAEKPISALVHDQIQIARGEVVAVDYISHGKPRFEATIDDGTGNSVSSGSAALGSGTVSIPVSIYACKGA